MLSSRSVKCSSDTLRASLTLRRSPLPPTPHPRLLTGIYLHIRTPSPYLSTQATPPSRLPCQPDPGTPHLSVVPLPSPRTIQIQHTTAVRRGAARPRRSDQAAAGETLSCAGRRPHRRACMGCRAPQAPSTRTRLGVPARGRSAWWPRRSGCRPRLRQPVHVLGQRPVSSVRCPVRATSVHACLSTGPMSSVRCGRPVRASKRPGVRCPASGVGVRCGLRCLCVAASAVSGRSEVLERGVGQAAVRLGLAGVGVVAGCVHARLVVCLSRSLALEAGAGGAGPAEASVWTWPSSWEVVGQWPARPRGRPG
jgi:hypothetical protein